MCGGAGARGGGPPEGAPAAGELLHVMLPLRRTALAERVDIGDGAQTVEAVRDGDVGGLPDRALGRLAIAEQAIGAVIRLDPARVQRDPHGGADALAERSGRDVHKRQPRRRMPFQIGIDPAQFQQLGPIERACRSPRGVQHGRRVALREHEPIAARMRRIGRIEAHFGEKQTGDQIRRRAAAGRMAAAGLGRRSDRIDAQPGRDICQGGNERCTIKRPKCPGDCRWLISIADCIADCRRI